MTPRITVTVAIAVLSTAPGTAMAGNFTKQAIDMQNVEVTLHQAPSPMKNLQSEPTMTVEEFLGRTQARLHAINRKQLINMRDLIQLAAPDDPQLPDYYFRQGELFAEQYRILTNLVRGLDEPIFRAEHQSSATSTATVTVHRGVQ